ncbi:MAG: hypothetical protein CMM58_01630 [Rhodospirillaceae bacterium]|nr:hypothetical protein [Rhodospirillaceae bacterium]|tara:strand:- start:670 stop:1245 length:576 start_codon:yes stop_codon:yes gene_type:complete
MRFQGAFPVTTIITTLFVVIALLLSEITYGTPQKSSGMAKFVQDPPHLAIPLTSIKDSTGKLISLAQFEGNWLLINFWATWCAPCVDELPSINRLMKNIKSPNFKVLLISIDRGGIPTFLPFLKKLGMSELQSASDPQAKLMRKLQLTGIPTTILVSPQGRIVGKLIGNAQWDSEAATKLIRSFTEPDSPK